MDFGRLVAGQLAAGSYVSGANAFVDGGVTA